MQRRDLLASLMTVTASTAAPLRHPRLDEAAALIAGQVRAGKVRAATLLVRHGTRRFEAHFGEARSIDTVFLIASITKPMTAAGVMKLVDQKRIALSDLAQRYLPEFNEGERQRITIRHLLTHTSGLPDQLPENVELRRRHAPLAEFVARSMKTPLLFPPGTRVSYQSMGILLAAEIVRRVTGTPFPQFLEREIFRPLGMRRTALGLGRFRIADTARCQVEHTEAQYGADPSASSWNWNSPYWRNLGAPWGGAHSTAPDIARLLDYFLRPDGRILSPQTAASMVTNQNQGLNQPWGLGWALGGGKGCSPRTFGHSGSTGTRCWADPARDLTFVILTTLPARVSEKSLITPVSDLVSQVA